MQDLRLEAADCGTDGQPTFDSALLSGLTRLRRLRLTSFGLLRLENLPSSLRTLRVIGGNIFAGNDDDQEPFVLSLPPHCWCEALQGGKGCCACVRVARGAARACQVWLPVNGVITHPSCASCSIDTASIVGYFQAMLDADLVEVGTGSF